MLILGMAGCGDRDTDPVDGYLREAWAAYQSRYVHTDGYVLDPRRDGGRVTSEGQGYALLRAAWERDEPSFRRIAEWTRVHLQRPDGLHSWLWSPEDGGRVVDANTATDGDLEIAWALILAADLFEDDGFRNRGGEILRAVRARASLELADGGWFPAAGDWAVDERIANFSYFMPYAHPWFAAVDPEGHWDAVTDVGYDVLSRWMADDGHKLPPAFFQLDRDGEPYPLPSTTELETEFAFDAIRVFWRIEADCRLRKEGRDCDDPIGVARALALLVDSSGIVSRYASDGSRLTTDQSTTFYAALLPAARRHAPRVAEEVLLPRLDSVALELLLAAPDRYYDQNWVWFGLALDRGLIVERTPPPR